MEGAKPKKYVFFPHTGVSSAKEIIPSLPKHTSGERLILSDGSNIPHCNDALKHAQARKADFPKAIKARQPLRTTPGHLLSRKKCKTKPKRNVFISGPDQVLPLDEPMEFDDPAQLLREHLKTIPASVNDIDAGKGEFYSPCYAQDIMDYLQALETRWTFPEEFLDGDSTANMRSVLVNWLIQVQVHEDLLDETLHLTVALIDRYLCIKIPPVSQIQLLGITAVLVATKYIERFPPEISVLCHLTDNTYTIDDVLKMEMHLLRRLKFDIIIASPTTFLERFLQAETHDDKVAHLAKYLLDLSLTNISSVHFVPSMLAASCVFVARKVFQPLMGVIWTPNLAFYTRFSESDLAQCIKHLSKALSKAPNSKFQAAHSKYNRSKYANISVNPLVTRICK